MKGDLTYVAQGSWWSVKYFQPVHLSDPLESHEPLFSVLFFIVLPNEVGSCPYHTWPIWAETSRATIGVLLYYGEMLDVYIHLLLDLFLCFAPNFWARLFLIKGC